MILLTNTKAWWGSYKNHLLIIALSVLAISFGVTAYIYFNQPQPPQNVVKVPPKVNSADVPIEALDSSYLPDYPGAELFTPSVTDPLSNKSAKYYRLAGENRLKEIHDWYEDWFKNAGYTIEQSRNMDGSWSIAANTEQENRTNVSGSYQNNYNVIRVE